MMSALPSRATSIADCFGQGSRRHLPNLSGPELSPPQVRLRENDRVGIRLGTGCASSMTRAMM